MSYKLATFAVACTQVVFGLASTKSGFKASIDVDVLAQAKDVYFDNLISVVNNLVIPDFFQDKNHFMKGNHFQLNERTSDVTIHTDLKNNALILKCAKLSGKFIGDEFRYKKDLLVAAGHLEVDIDTIMIQFGI
jgi:hypothetical protein